MIKKKEEKEGNSERWLLTYSDLITLLMIFFVVMYASSNVDNVKYRQVMNSFVSVFGNGSKSIIGTSDGVSTSEDIKPIDTALVEENKLHEVKNNMDKYLEKNNLKNSVDTKIEERGLVVSIKDTMFFDTGKADIRPESKQKLIEIGKILNQMGNYIRVEGHTDNVPICNDKFRSNWQLSAIRATNATELFINGSGIPPQMVCSVGYGEFRPIGNNSTSEGRRENRRVDIIIMNSKYNQIENNKTNK